MWLPAFQQHFLARPHYRDANDPRNLGGLRVCLDSTKLSGYLLEVTRTSVN
jgi:hypothetical protein